MMFSRNKSRNQNGWLDNLKIVYLIFICIFSIFIVNIFRLRIAIYQTYCVERFALVVLCPFMLYILKIAIYQTYCVERFTLVVLCPFALYILKIAIYQTYCVERFTLLVLCPFGLYILKMQCIIGCVHDVL